MKKVARHQQRQARCYNPRQSSPAARSKQIHRGAQKPRQQVRGQPHCFALAQQPQRAVLLRIGHRVHPALARTVAAVQQTPGQPEQRLHQRRMLAVVAKPAVDDAAIPHHLGVTVAQTVHDFAVVANVIFGGQKVIAFVAGKALGATCQLQRHRGHQRQ